MNHFLSQSIELANQRDYLDQLFRVYPMCPDNIRDIDSAKWNSFEKAFNCNQQETMIESLLDFDLFPIKYSYIAYLRRDRTAIKRNPATIARIWGSIRFMKTSPSPKKPTNRQIGPLFKRWVNSGVLGIQPVSLEEFKDTNKNAILNASDLTMQEFARENLGYTRLKGLDFIARFNGKIIIGEAKFLSDFGGHQNAQLEDAMSLLNMTLNADIIKIAILDGVYYIHGRNKMFEILTQIYKDNNILSALLLRDFLYQV